LKFPPEKVDSLLDTMFGGQGFIDDEWQDISFPVEIEH
jgi:hypothetical protein